MINIVKKDNSFVELNFKFDERVINIIKTLNNRSWDRDKGVWKVPLTDYDKLIKVLKEYELEYTFIDEVSNKVLVDFELVQPKLKLLPEQEEVAQFLLNNTNTINNSSIGYGKTAISLITALTLKKSKGIGSCLIVCPSSLKQQWCNEILKFTGEQYNLIDGPKKKRIYRSDAFFTVVSYELVRLDIEKINKISWDLLICDEIVRIKNHRTKLAKVMRTINTKQKISLTGAILENKIEELFNIINFTSPGTFSNYNDFAKRFLIRKLTSRPWGKYYEITGYKNLDALKLLMNDFLIKRKLTDLPIKTEKTYVVKMNAEQKNLYDRIEHDCYDDLVDHNGLTKTVYLREICDDPRLFKPEEGKGEKLKEINEIVKTIEGKCVIFTQFKRFADMIYASLTVDGVEIVHGELSGAEKWKRIEKWKESGSVLITTDCLSYGINLQEANILINADLPWNPMKLQQRIGRIYRRGQTKGCLIINIVMKDTIEEKMLVYINKKILLINTITDDDIKTFKISNNRDELKKMLKGDR